MTYDEWEFSYKEISDYMGLPVSRIMQIEQSALKKLCHPKICGNLKKYLDDFGYEARTEKEIDFSEWLRVIFTGAYTRSSYQEERG